MKFCFICGCPRSGTTAITQAINEHPDAIIGVERYKYIAIGGKGGDFTPDLFERDRFIDIRSTDTNGIHANQAIAQKATTLWPPHTIGEKIPRLYMRQKYLKETFPDSKLVAIVRDPLAVALSWQARADDPKDQWPNANGALKAFDEWNKSVEFIASAIPNWKDNLIVINYDTFFGYADLFELQDKIATLYDRLMLDQSTDILRHTARSLYRPPSNKPPKPTPDEYLVPYEQARSNSKLSEVLALAI